MPKQPMNTPINKLLNQNSDRIDAKQAAELIGVSSATLATWRCTKKEQIPYYKIGNKVFYKTEHILAWIETKKVGYTDEVITS